MGECSLTVVSHVRLDEREPVLSTDPLEGMVDMTLLTEFAPMLSRPQVGIIGLGDGSPAEGLARKVVHISVTIAGLILVSCHGRSCG